MGTSSLTCDHCQQPLTALARQRGLTRCEAAACRAAYSLRELENRWKGVAEAALKGAAKARPLGPAPTLLLWLEDAGRARVPVNDDDRRFLAARWQQAWLNDTDHVSDAQEVAADLPPEVASLCGHCAGRCCAYGASQAAFIGAAELRRWLGRHPGTTVDDAIADYLAHLPAEHVQAHCSFQGAAGCALPREQRSDICNGYRCDALNRLGAAAAHDAQVTAVVLTRAQRRLAAAVLFQHGVATPLADVPGPDNLAEGTA